MNDEYDLINVDGDIYARPNIEYWKGIKKEKYNLLLKKTGIPSFYYNIEFDDYIGDKSRENLDKLRYMIENIDDDKFKDISLYLWGSENSVQKTAVACNFGKSCLKKGLNVKFMNFGIFVDYGMKMQGFKYNEEAHYKLKELKEADIIILDDVFDPNKSLLWKGENKGMIINVIDTFFRESIYNHKRFVLTSNLSLGMIKENYGESLYKLIERNSAEMQFLDSINEVRKFRLEEIWKDMNK